MALGNEEFYSEFSSNTNVDYKVTIYNSDYSGATSNKFTLENGFTLTWDGRNQDRYHAIKASSCQFTMLVNAAVHETFISGLRNAKQNQYKVKIEADISGTGAGYSDYWYGVIIPDVGAEEDVYLPRPFSFRAVDGLSLMKDIAFNTNVYNGVVGSVTTLYTFKNIICNLLRYYTPTTDFFSSTDLFITTIVQWMEDSMVSTPIVTQDPLALSAMYPKGFIDVDNNGVEKPLSAYDALEQIAKTWGARIFFSNGKWHFVQVGLYNQTAIYHRDYKYTAGLHSTGTLAAVDYKMDINSVNNYTGSGGIKLSGSQFEYLTPLLKTEAIYGNWPDYGMYGEEQYLDEYTTLAALEAAMIDLGYVQSATDATINIDHKTEIFVTADAFVYGTLWPYYQVIYMLKVGSYYWDGAQWTTTQSSFIGADSPTWAFAASWIGASTIQVMTDTLPTSDNLYYGVQKFISDVDNPNVNISVTSGGSLDATDVLVRIKEHEVANPSYIYYAVNGNFDIERVFGSGDASTSNNLIADLGTMRIGDGPTTSAPSWGRIRVYDGANWTNDGVDNVWQAWGAGVQGNITSVLCEQHFMGQRDFIPKNLYNFTFRNRVALDFMVGLVDGTNLMVPNGLVFEAAMDEVKGEYYLTNENATGITNNSSAVTASPNSILISI